MDTTRRTMSSNPFWRFGMDTHMGEGNSSSQEEDTNNNAYEELLSSLILPDLRGQSDILTKMHIRELSNNLPARAEGYSWTLCFSTEHHGFSLKSLYRSLSAYEGPVLLIVRDSEQQVFGVFSSCKLNPSDSFYGTGETYLFTFKQSTQTQANTATPAVASSTQTQMHNNPSTLAATTVTASGSEPSATKGNQKDSKPTQFARYPWTGDNLYFIKGNADSLAFGAGEGKYGLWLDSDLYHGSTHPCKTFNNEPLTNHEDFVVCTLECWCFF